LSVPFAAMPERSSRLRDAFLCRAMFAIFRGSRKPWASALAAAAVNSPSIQGTRPTPETATLARHGFHSAG
jgi:hypothetical protein